jgi:hypothetical protein
MAVRRVFHLTAVVPDRDAALEALGGLVGATVLHAVSDVTAGAALRRALVWIGGTVLEVLEPEGPSPFADFLARFGPGLSAIGVEVEDMAATRAVLAAHDVGVAIEFGPDMVATRPSATAGLAFQWTDRTVGGDPRDGHDAPPAPAGSALGTPRLAATLAVVADPLADGVRLAGVLGTTCTVLDDRLEAPATSVGLGDGSLVLTAVGDAGAWGTAPSRPKAQGLAFEVPDVDLATAAAEGRGLHVVGRHLVGPVVAGGALPCPVAFTEALPAGDPRA